LALATSAGCGVTFGFDYGNPPVAPLSSSAYTRCTFRKTITVRRASISWDDSRAFHGYNVSVVILRERRMSALSFYQGDKLVDADSVLKAIKDPELAIAYRKLYEKGKRSQRVAKLVAWISMGVAAATALVSTALIADFGANDRSLNQVYAGIGFAGVALVGVIVGAIQFGTAADRGDVVEAYERVFLARDYESHMRAAVRRYNAEAPSRCAGGAPAE